MGPVKRSSTASTSDRDGWLSDRAITAPSASRVSVCSPKAMVKSYILEASSIRPQSLVASPTAIGNTPVESGSSVPPCPILARSEEHTSELQSLMRTSYADFCLKKQHETHPTTT